MKRAPRLKFDAHKLRSNIAHVYSLATREDIDKGSQWYPLAHNIVREWADTYGRSIGNVACVVAALSPQNEWTRNLLQASDILAGNRPTIGGIETNIRKAQAIANDLATDTLAYFPSGYKVRSFACNLAGDSAIVTCDTHALQIALGSPLARVTFRNWSQYAEVANAYQDVAAMMGLEPSTLQATTWITWKRIYPPEDKRALIHQSKIARTQKGARRKGR